MTTYDHLRVERDAHLDGLLTVTLDRPEKLNALSIAVHDELQHLCADARDRPRGAGGDPHRCRAGVLGGRRARRPPPDARR